MKRKLQNVLIANRGEITVRIARTLHSLGIRSVALYTQHDSARALHVKACDTSYFLAGNTAKETYLNPTQIVAAAKNCGADAIHPGYGFLSENADFAQLCEDNGICFIGPTPKAIDLMGNKGTAKKLLNGDKDIPLIPGYNGTNQETNFLKGEALKIGFPVLIKAAAGGGGKGMRVVRAEKDLEDAIDSARTEAKNSFGDDFLLIEKYFDRVRHIEIQIFGDQYGNVIHLGERECSVQRRHQKVLEESPSVVMTPQLREKMGASAVKIGKKIDYRGAGTVEFIVDEQLNYYFLEVNTRLQVEHPVTESVVGLDLVKLQIQIAEGYSLPEVGLTQKDVHFKGHAIECRLYAEDPLNNFFPCTGIIKKWQQSTIQGIRYDTGITTGSEISIYYDPMIAKIISYAETRELAIFKLIQALAETQCLGLTTNKFFLMQCLSHPKFQSGQFSTHFIQEEFPNPPAPSTFSQEVLVAATLYDWSCRDSQRSTWKNISSGWRNVPDAFQKKRWIFEKDSKKQQHLVQYHFVPVNPYKANPNVLNQKHFNFKLSNDDSIPPLAVILHEASPEHIVCSVNGKGARFFFARDVQDLSLNNNNNTHAAQESRLWVHSDQLGDFGLQMVPKFPNADSDSQQSSLLGNTAPMPGKIFKLVARSGDSVKVGDVILIMESMKMEVKIPAKRDGRIEILVKEGELVQPGKVLFRFAQEEEKK